MYLKRSALAAYCITLSVLLALHPADSRSAPPAAQASAATLAPLEQAHTFAQVRQGQHGGRIATLLVLARTASQVEAIDLSALSGLYGLDAFDVIRRFDAAALDALARSRAGVRTVPFSSLLGVGPRGLAHVAAGTNYPAHGAEVGVDDAFLFPKLSAASGPDGAIAAAPGALLDYEVEVCARFDRELRSLADFDAARKGFFLCGDFTDRATLVRNIDLKNIPSGDGFADAKSGPRRFPAGQLLVVPRDWKAFLDRVHIATFVNGERRQLARAGDMIKDLRAIVGETLAQAHTRTWSYRGARIPMVERGAIGTESAILTGTGEGVVFQQPGPEVMREVMTASDRARQLAVVERYLAGQERRRIYLQPGDEVRHASNYLGAIRVRVVAPSSADRD